MSVPKKPVTKDEFHHLLASTLGIQLVDPQDEQDYLALLDASVADLEAVAALPSYTHPALLLPRRKSSTAAEDEEEKERTYREPAPGENPLNGWRFRTLIKQQPPQQLEQSSLPSSSPRAGPGPGRLRLLAGKTIAVKDNIAVAGLPLTGGTQPYHLTCPPFSPPPLSPLPSPGSSLSSSSRPPPPPPYPVSQIDAPVVARVLAAGATVTGTSTCENYCMSGLSFTSATGPVNNAWAFVNEHGDKEKGGPTPTTITTKDRGKAGYTVGGSSSGSAALLAVTSVRRWRARRRHAGRGVVGESPSMQQQEGDDDEEEDGLGEGVEFALGSDQGGSIRLPAGYSGIYGLKPTHGLVPYTGCTPLHPLIDHCGPMAPSLRDTALLLAVLAGYDGFDPRMTPETLLRARVPLYHEVLDKAIAARAAAGNWTPTTAARGLRVGLLHEAWAAPQLTEQVASVVRAAARRFAALGADVVEPVSVPLHAVGTQLFTAVTLGGMADVFLRNKPPELLSWPSVVVAADGAPSSPASWYETMNKAAPTVVNSLLGSTLVNSDPARFPPAARAKALTHVHELRAAYDAALEAYDVLITPATPTVARRHPDPHTSVKEKHALALGITYNTCPFNLTGHPGLVMPVGWGQEEEGGPKLPIGMQLVGKRWREDDLFLAAAAWEVGGLGLDG